MALADWVDIISTNCSMVIYGGFDPQWAAGKLERQIVDSKVKQFGSNQKIFFAVTSWHDPQDILHKALEFNPDHAVLFSLSDPIGPSEKLIEQYPCPVTVAGYVKDKDNFIDFWAIACLKFFCDYSTESLIPTQPFSKIFLNYNRKPHPHRRMLITKLESANLIDYGVVTLGNSNYNLNESINEYRDYGALDVVGDLNIPNDIYSLGNLEIWNSCFLNIVSETEYAFNENIFLSEKIFKPIIGLRPFIINGSPGIYRILQNAGFDCFNDIFEVDKFLRFEQPTLFSSHSVIIDAIKKLQNENLNELYKQLLPRLIYNRNLFFKYAKCQQSKALLE